MYFVKETTTESVSGPPDISVPAARAVSEIFSPRFFASDANRTSADTSSASLGETTSAGFRSKILVSRLNFLSVSASSCTSPLMSGAICERKSIGKLYHLATAEREGFGHAYFSAEKLRDPDSARRPPSFESLPPDERNTLAGVLSSDTGYA